MFSQHQSYLVEAWRMFHSVASQLEYLCTVNRTLQSLVNEEVSRAFRPVLDDDERTVGDTSYLANCEQPFSFLYDRKTMKKRKETRHEKLLIFTVTRKITSGM